MTITIKHAKTNAIADWTQPQLDTIVAGGAAPLPPSGTTLSQVVLPSDWNNDHVISTAGAADGYVLKVVGGEAEWAVPGTGSALYLSTAFTAQTSVTVTHNFGAYPLVNVIDNTGAEIIPLTVTHTSLNAFTVTFSASTTGTILSTAGGAGATGTPGGSSGQVQFNNGGAFGGTAAATYATSGTHFTLTAQAASDRPLVIKGAAAQTANLFEIQNSAATNLFSVSAGTATGVTLGMFSNGGTFTISTSGNVATLSGGNHDLSFNGVYAARNISNNALQLRVRGGSSQTSNLQEWQNSAGSVVASVGPLGQVTIQTTSLNPLTVNSGATSVFQAISSSSTNNYVTVGGYTTLQMIGTVMYLGSTATGGTFLGSNTYSVGVGIAPTTAQHLLVSTTATTRIGLTVRGVASQTADLQQWQTSAGTIVNRILADGTIGTGYGDNGMKPVIIPAGALAGSGGFAYKNFFGATCGYILGDNSGGISFLNASGDIIFGIPNGGTRMQYQSIQTLTAGFDFAPAIMMDATGGDECGFYLPLGMGANTLGIVTDRIERMRFGATGNILINGFTASTKGVVIKGAASQTANLTEWQNVGGTALASIKATGVLNLPSFTVATLPTGVNNDRAFVTDALSPVWGSAVVGGGAVRVPVYFDGAWKVG